MYAKMQDIAHTHKLISPSLSFKELVRMKNHIFLLNFTHKLSLSLRYTHTFVLYTKALHFISQSNLSPNLILNLKNVL